MEKRNLIQIVVQTTIACIACNIALIDERLHSLLDIVALIRTHKYACQQYLVTQNYLNGKLELLVYGCHQICMEHSLFVLH